MDISKHIDSWRVIVENGMTGLETSEGVNSISSISEPGRSELDILTDKIYKTIKEKADTNKFRNDIRTLINLILSMYKSAKDPSGGDVIYLFNWYTDTLFFDDSVGKMMKKAAELKMKEKLEENTGTDNNTNNNNTENIGESFSDEDRNTMKKLGIGSWLSDDEFAEWLKNDYAKRSVQDQLRIYGIILKKLNGDQEKAIKMFEYFEEIISRFNSAWKRNEDFDDNDFHNAYEHLDNWVKQMGGHSNEIDELVQIVKSKFKADADGLSNYYKTHDYTGD